MPQSLMQIADTNKAAATGMFRQLGQNAAQRRMAGDQLDAQHKQNQISGAGTAIGTGVMAGMAFGGPVGLAVGGALLLGSFL